MKLDNKKLMLLLVFLALAATFGALLLTGSNGQAPNSAAAQSLIFSEICAKNDTVLPDNSGRTPDYVELYNPGDAVDLTGYVFTNGAQVSTPLDGIAMEAGERRVFFLSPEHGSFSLSASGGDVLRLLDGEGRVAAQASILPSAGDQVMLYSEAGYTVSDQASPGFANDEAGRQAFLVGAPAQQPQLVLSEVLSSNVFAMPDEQGSFCDVVELYNASQQSVSLEDYWLSDHMNSRFSWRLPQGQLMPGGYLLIFCDGENYIAEDGTIHSGFALSRGETLVLTDRQGLYQSIAIESASDDVSQARQEDGSFAQMPASLGFPNNTDGSACMKQSRTDYGSSLVIQELVLSQAGVPYEGALQDVVEIANRSENAQSTAGWYLSDGSDPYAYALPETVLEPGQCLTLACGPETTGFSLSVGETVYLTGPSHFYAPPVACLEAEKGKSIQLIWAEEEASLTQGDVSLGYENSEAGQTAWQQTSMPQGLCISEVMTANSSYLKGAYGKTYDWVELYNGSNVPIQLSDYTFTDDPDRPEMYALPARTLAPGGYLVLIFTDKTESLPKGYGVVPITLSSQGDSIYLCKDGKIEDYVHVPALATDASFGRASNCQGFSYLANPSPEKKNGAEASPSQAPVAVTAQGCYEGVEYMDVELSGPGPIYYTTDATTPGENAKLYTGPIRIRSTTVIRAQCREPGKQPSQVLDLTYLINEGDQLDVITLVSDPKYIWNEKRGIYVQFWSDIEVPATVSLLPADGTGFSQPCGLKIFGGMTRMYAKKSFACMFRDRYGAAKLQYPLFGEDGLDEFQSFILRSGGQDSFYARIRDELITSLVGEHTDVAVQAYRPVTVYLNGSFWGVYFLREKANADYVAGHYNVAAQDVVIESGNGATKEYRALVSYAANHDLTQQEHYDYIASQIDIDEYIDFHVAQIWIANEDVGNIKFFKTSQSKWTWLLYDTDMALRDAQYNSVTDYLKPAGNGSHNRFSNKLIRALLENAQFREKFLRRMAWQMENIWSEEQISGKIDELVEILEHDMARDTQRWKRTEGAWEKRIEALRKVAAQRNKYMYRYIRSYFRLSNREMEELGFHQP